MKKTLMMGTILIPFPALAQVVALDQEPTIAGSINFNSIVLSLVSTALTVIGAVATAYFNARMKDNKDSATLSNALNNSLGAIKMALDNELKAHPLQKEFPSLSPSEAAGVQYVIDHAGDEARRFGLTDEAIIDKVKAKIGLSRLAVPPLPVAVPAPVSIMGGRPLT